MFLFPRSELGSEEKDDSSGRERSKGGFREADCRECGSKEILGGDVGSASTEGVIPIVEGRREKLDGGMKSDHGPSHVLAGGVEIEAAPEAAALVKEFRDPGGIGSGTRGG